MIKETNQPEPPKNLPKHTCIFIITIMKDYAEVFPGITCNYRTVGIILPVFNRLIGFPTSV